MTGTGTQNDPYIVDNWADYVSVYTNSTYIQWDPDSANKEIDFNTVQPEGFTSSIPWSANVAANGWTFKNAYSTAVTFIGSGGALSGLHFENIVWIPRGSYPKLINGNVRDSLFSGQFEATQNSITIANNNVERCGITLVGSVNGTLKICGGTYIKDSEIKLDVSGTTVTLLANGNSYYIHNSRIHGKIVTSNSIVLGGSSSAYNVFDIETDGSLTYTGSGISIYNSDKANSASASSTFKGVSSEQLIDVNYLRSIRFPCGG